MQARDELCYLQSLIWRQISRYAGDGKMAHSRSGDDDANTTYVSASKPIES
jgi:hypothetical protein